MPELSAPDSHAALTYLPPLPPSTTLAYAKVLCSMNWPGLRGALYVAMCMLDWLLMYA